MGQTLIIHLADKQVKNWHQICTNQKHFIYPMIGSIVEKEIKKIIPQYSKGSFPAEIQINDESLQRLYKNQENQIIKFRSDFVDVIKQLLKPSK